MSSGIIGVLRGAEGTSESIGQKPMAEITLVELLLVIIFAWIIISIYDRCASVFIFSTLGVKRSSSFQILIIALAFTAILIAFTYIPNVVVSDTLTGLYAGQQYQKRSMQNNA